MKTSSKIAIAAAAVGAWLLAKKKQSVSGIGGVLWEYAIMECWQKGIDLNHDYFAQPSWAISELTKMRKKFGYRQSESSKAMGRSENQSFYYALCRHADKM